MKFTTLSVHNFLSLGDIELNLDNQGLVLICGQNLDNPSLNNNGAGKSSILEAIVYALYGRTVRGLSGDSVVNQNVGKNTCVKLEIIDDDGSKFQITRYRKHSQFKNRFSVFHNEIDVTPKSENDFNAYISNLLQADYTTFIASILYSADSFKFAIATDSEIKKIFDTMLSLDVFSKALDISKQRLKESSLKSEEISRQIRFLENRLSELQESIAKATESQANFEIEKNAKTKNLQDSLADVETSSKSLITQISDLEEQLTRQKRSVFEVQDNILEKKQELKQLKSLKEELNQIKQEIANLENQIVREQQTIKFSKNQMTQSADSIISINKKIKDIRIGQRDLSKAVCPMCNQPLAQHTVKDLEKEMDQQIAELNQAIPKYEDQIFQAQLEIQKSEDSIKSMNQKIQELSEQADRFIRIIQNYDSMESSLDKLNSKLELEKSKLSEIQSEIRVKNVEHTKNQELVRTLQKSLQDLRDSKNPYESMIESYNVEREKLIQESKSLEEKLNFEKAEESRIQFWTQGFSNHGIKSFIIDNVVPFLNRRLNKYLSKLTSGQIEAIFSTRKVLKSGEEKEKFSMSLINKNGGSTYSANSGGEKKRIDLAINLAMQDLVSSRSSKKLNLALFDETFDSLDENGIDGVVSLLQELAHDKSTILIISHSEYLKSFFTNSITMRKKDGISSILQNS